MVKISDKIAYLGRDIEDAVRLKFIGFSELRKLNKISRSYSESAINTTVIIHKFITDICENSSPEKGILLSEKYNNMLNEIKRFNYEHIYSSAKFNVYKEYVRSVIRAVYLALIDMYDKEHTLVNLKKLGRDYPMLSADFLDFLCKYVDKELLGEKAGQYKRYKNEKIYGTLDTKQIYAQAIIDFISGMTDRYAIEIYNELLKY